ncbi:MAG: hypothetical protein FJ264_12990 [Planctomycetes bacterium]|nr:hypothetical protein [Planctomycetota bacterium]
MEELWDALCHEEQEPAYAEIKTMGWKALVKELGYSWATKFMLLYEKREGDYTKLRKELFKDITIDDIVSEMRETEKQ